MKTIYFNRLLLRNRKNKTYSYDKNQFTIFVQIICDLREDVYIEEVVVRKHFPLLCCDTL